MVLTQLEMSGGNPNRFDKDLSVYVTREEWGWVQIMFIHKCKDIKEADVLTEEKAF